MPPPPQVERTCALLAWAAVARFSPRGTTAHSSEIDCRIATAGPAAPRESAPARISDTSFSRMPRRIGWPRPPAPMIAPSVAKPTFCTPAVRMPARMVGSAMGSSISASRAAGPRPKHGGRFDRAARDAVEARDTCCARWAAGNSRTAPHGRHRTFANAAIARAPRPPATTAPAGPARESFATARRRPARRGPVCGAALAEDSQAPRRRRSPATASAAPGPDARRTCGAIICVQLAAVARRPRVRAARARKSAAACDSRQPALLRPRR